MTFFETKILFPKYPDPSKQAIFENLDPCVIQIQTLLLEGPVILRVLKNGSVPTVIPFTSTMLQGRLPGSMPMEKKTQVDRFWRVRQFWLQENVRDLGEGNCCERFSWVKHFSNVHEILTGVLGDLFFKGNGGWVPPTFRESLRRLSRWYLAIKPFNRIWRLFLGMQRFSQDE